jgi:hypothetical protein
MGFARLGDGKADCAVFHLELSEADGFVCFGVRTEGELVVAGVFCETFDVATDGWAVEENAGGGKVVHGWIIRKSQTVHRRGAEGAEEYKDAEPRITRMARISGRGWVWRRNAV